MTPADDRGAGAVPAARLARLLQFGDSMFPIGAFAFSAGLESAIQTGVVTDGPTLFAYARTAIDQANRGDGVALVHAHRAAAAGDLDALARIDALVHARTLSSEARTMSVRLGKRCTEMAAHVLGVPLLLSWSERIEAGEVPGCYPVALAASFAAQGQPALDAFVVHQYGVGTTILGAALRLMRIDHLDTQRMLYALNGDVEAAYRAAAATELSDMSGFAPLIDILAAVHVRAHVRLFMS
jgi:urease accessory protein